MAPRIDSDCIDPLPRTPTESTKSDKSIHTLPSLTPTALQPACASERGRALLALSTIDAIRVTSHPTRDAFILNTFIGSSGFSPTCIEGCGSCQTDSHIPTRLRDRHASIPMHQRFLLPSCECEDAEDNECCIDRSPDTSTEKQLAAFMKLRDALYNAALASHTRVLTCDFCREVIDFALWAHRIPVGFGARLLFHHDREMARAAEILSAFTSELLARTLRPPCVDRFAAEAALGDPIAAAGVPWCRAQSRVPVVVHEFLMEMAGASR